MIPVFSTGLHCDADSRGEFMRYRLVIPVFSTGLHCDTSVPPGVTPPTITVIPVFSTGLHCDSPTVMSVARDEE